MLNSLDKAIVRIRIQGTVDFNVLDQRKRALLAFSHASNLCVWFRAGFVLSFKWIPSELNFSDEGSRFFDRDCDSCKSLLHVLAQRSTRYSRAQTSDQDCFSPSLMHLDVGEVNLTSHIHVPAVSVHSHVPSNVLSNCKGHAAVPLLGRMIAFSGSMSHGSCTPLTFSGLPLGLVGSQCLDESQMQWLSAETGAEARNARSPTKVSESAQVTRLLAPPPDAKRPSRMSPCQRSVIQCPMAKVGSCLENVAVSKSLVQLAREVPRVQGQPAGKEEHNETSDENGPLLVPKSARAVSGRRHHLVRMLVDHVMCRDGRSEETLLERRVVRTLAAQRLQSLRRRKISPTCSLFHTHS